MNTYKKNVEEILFKQTDFDPLFKNGVTSVIKDKKRFLRALEILNEPKNCTIYEFGPYPGTGIYYFGEHNKIIGIGNSNAEFEKSVEMLGNKIISIDLESFHKLDLETKGDIVLIMEVIEHIRNPYRFLKGASKLVNKDGLLYLTTNNFSYIGYIYKLFFNKPILDSINSEKTFYPGHCRYYNLEELRKVFEELGFEVIYANYVNFLPKYKFYRNVVFGFFKNLLVSIVPKRFGTHLEILVSKRL